MTTTQTKTDLAQDEESCPKCSVVLQRVEGTDVVHCDACGYTAGDVVGTGPEVVTPEVVDRTPPPPSTEVEERGADVARMNRTMETILEHQSIPDRDQFLTMSQTAVMLSRSQGVPEALRDPYTAFHVVMMGRALNLDPATAINLIDVIGYDKRNPDNPVQLSLSPELLIARVKMMGLGSVELIERTKISATAVALRPDGFVERDDLTGKPTRIVGEIGRVTFDWDGAMDAELVDDRCLLNGETGRVIHWKKPGTNGRGWSNQTPNGCRCRGYKTYPENMFGWRAMGYAAHAHFPQATLGLYSPEELGAAVDEHGRAIDPATVELPPGYDQATGMTTQPSDATEPAAPEDVALIKARVANLPHDVGVRFRERWAEKAAEGRLGPVNALTVTQHNIAKALVNGAEAEAKKVEGWRPVTEVPPSPPESPPAGDEGPPEGESPPQGSGGDETAAEAPAVEPLQESLLQEARSYSEVQMNAAIAAVSIMTPRALNAALRERDLKVDGLAENVRRQNLCVVLAREAAQDELAGSEPPPAGE